PADPADPPKDDDDDPQRNTGAGKDDDDPQRDTDDGNDEERQVALNPNVRSASALTTPLTRSNLALSAPGPGVSTGLASQDLPEIAPPAIAAPQIAVPEIAAPAFPAPAVAPVAQPAPTLTSLLGVIPQPWPTSPVLIAARAASSELPPSVPAAAWALLAAVLGWRLVRPSRQGS
ncbi:MAG: hypothetical protein M3415_01320, partial [Actinomycetota bacterium]|nr:hypothetical protein [Actinomycetota bacterium]